MKFRLAAKSGGAGVELIPSNPVPRKLVLVGELN